MKVVLCVREKGKVKYFTLLGVRSISFNSEYFTIRHGKDVLVYNTCDVLQFDTYFM